MVGKVISISIVAALLSCDGNAQDIKGGEITTSMNSSPLQVNATVSLYVKASLDINRAFVILHWGDAEFDTLYSGASQTLTLDTRLYTYSSSHTYANPGNYTLSVRDSFRISGVCNISSSPEEFYVSAEITLAPTLGNNSSPGLFTYQVPCTYSAGYVNHNPGALDPDGDSLCYSLVSPYTNQYAFPNASINPNTGDFVMPILNQDSTYLVVIRIDEWKRDVSGQYMHVGYVVRDMTIEVPLIISVPELSTTSVSVYPNPATDFVTFEFSGNQQQRELMIYDAFGKEVWREETDQSSLSISVQEFSEGMYFYSVVGENGIAAKGKFLVD